MVRVLLLTALALFFAANCAQKSSSASSAKQIQIDDGGVAVAGGPVEFLGDGPVYQNLSVPQDFSLPMPTLTTGQANTIDLGRCYMDYLPAATNLDAETRRLCGLQFTQVQLELRALFLDLALPDIRAYCHNHLDGCNLSGQEFTITVSEPVMRRVQKLFEFYKYTGLEGYFQYNGYQIKNGAKIPFRIDEYAETCVDRFDYRAVIRTRVIATSGGEAQVRENAGDVVIYWDKDRKNILMDFRTSVEFFGFRINIRRTYDFSDRATGVRYTSSVNYWTLSDQGPMLAQVHNNAVVAEPCSNANQVCTKVRHIASELLGYDGDQNGLSGAEVISDVLRFSEGVIDDRGGIIDSYLTIAGNGNRQRLVFSGTTATDFIYSATAGSALTLAVGDAAAAAGNPYLVAYARPGRLNFSMRANLKQAQGLPSRGAFWLTPANARDATRLSGFAVSGASDNLVLRWGDGGHEQGSFAFGGLQAYQETPNVSEQSHPLF